MIPSRERKCGGETSTKSGCSKKKKMSVVIHVRSSLSGRKETDGTGRSMTEGQREKSFMYTAAFVFPGLEKNNIDRDIDDRGKKSYVEHQMTEEGQAHT